jgi:hypothetical protein
MSKEVGGIPVKILLLIGLLVGVVSTVVACLLCYFGVVAAAQPEDDTQQPEEVKELGKKDKKEEASDAFADVVTMKEGPVDIGATSAAEHDNDDDRMDAVNRMHESSLETRDMCGCTPPALGPLRRPVFLEMEQHRSGPVVVDQNDDDRMSVAKVEETIAPLQVQLQLFPEIQLQIFAPIIVTVSDDDRMSVAQMEETIDPLQVPHIEQTETPRWQ